MISAAAIECPKAATKGQWADVLYIFNKRQRQRACGAANEDEGISGGDMFTRAGVVEE